MFRTAVAVMMTLAIAGLAWAAPGSPAAAPRNDAWKVLGPGGGGAQFLPTISPHDPDFVIVRSDMTGTFISKDGGESWRMCNFRCRTDGYVFDPVDPNVVYTRVYGLYRPVDPADDRARVHGLYRSTDAGETWKLVFPRPENVTGIVFRGDEAEEMFTVAGEPEGLEAFAVDPADSKTLYAVMSTVEGPQLRISRDWGETWTSLGEVKGELGSQIFVDPHSPIDNRTIYVVASSVSVLEDGEWTYHAGPEGVQLSAASSPPWILQYGSITAAFPKDGGDLVIYGLTGGMRGDSGDIHVSRDGGRTWGNASGDLSKNVIRARLRAIAAGPGDPDTVYVSYSGYAPDSPEGDGIMGVAKTTDGGKTWKLVWKDTDSTPGENSKGAWLNERFSPGWGENPMYLTVAPGNTDICFATDMGRTMYTKDGGKTWHAAYSKSMPGGLWTTTGLDLTTCYGVHFDPFDENRILVSYTDFGAYASDDGGSLWKSAIVGVPRMWRNTTYWILFDPDVKGRAWAGVSRSHDLPRSKMWQGRRTPNYSGGIVLSDDSGRNWRPLTTEMPATSITHIIMDPKSPPEARVLYATGFGTGVWKSTDCGNSWQLKRNGLPGEHPFAWRLALDRNGVLYLVCARRSIKGVYGDDGDGAIYRSKDGGENWEKIGLPTGVNGPNDIAVDPEDPDRLYFAAWCRDTANGSVDGGVFLSTDAGKTWQNVLSEDQYVYSVTIDPRNPNVLYACGFSSSAWRSEDRGLTWSRIRGYNFKWGHRVIPDPHDAEMVYVTTFGGSVWYGPAKGDPEALEDIITPVSTPGNVWGRQPQ